MLLIDVEKVGIRTKNDVQLPNLFFVGMDCFLQKSPQILPVSERREAFLIKKLNCRHSNNKSTRNPPKRSSFASRHNQHAEKIIRIKRRRESGDPIIGGPGAYFEVNGNGIFTG